MDGLNFVHTKVSSCSSSLSSSRQSLSGMNSLCSGLEGEHNEEVADLQPIPSVVHEPIPRA